MNKKLMMTAAKPGLVAQKRTAIFLSQTTKNVMSFDPDEEEEETGDSAGGAVG